MSRDPERCPITGALVDACRHCVDDLPRDTPEHDDTEETPMPAPAPPPVPEAPDRVVGVVTLTWTVPVSVPEQLLACTAHGLGASRSEVLTDLARQAVARQLFTADVPVGKRGPGSIPVPVATLVDVDVQALP